MIDNRVLELFTSGYLDIFATLKSVLNEGKLSRSEVLLAADILSAIGTPRCRKFLWSMLNPRWQVWYVDRLGGGVHDLVRKATDGIEHVKKKHW